MTERIELSCALRRGSFELNVDANLGSRSTGIFGRSGSGKTSLLLALCGLLPAERLRLVVDGDVIVDSVAGVLPPAHRRRVGLVFQEHRLFPHRTVRANLLYGAGGGSAPAFDEVVDLLDVRPLLDRRPALCSGGERQRIAIGRALLAGPRLLCLDEPLASLDRGLKRQILPYLRRIRDRYRLPMLVVSHDLGDLLALSDELLLIDGGRAAGQGAPWELAQRPETLDLLHDCGLVFALVGEVRRRDDQGVTWVALRGDAGLELGCGGECDVPVGGPVEALVRPEDVILALPPLDASLSLTNHLRGRVESITRTDARSLVTIDAGLRTPVLAEVTERAIQRLGLTPGTDVIALVKAQAIRTRALG